MSVGSSLNLSAFSSIPNDSSKESFQALKMSCDTNNKDADHLAFQFANRTHTLSAGELDHMFTTTQNIVDILLENREPSF